jgi:hypothetical protein
MVLRCPVCRADNTQGPTCRRCKADLSLLFALEQQRARALQGARANLLQGRREEARALARLANHLRQDEESKRLLAVTALLCGDFQEALRMYRGLRQGVEDTSLTR